MKEEEEEDKMAVVNFWCCCSFLRGVVIVVVSPVLDKCFERDLRSTELLCRAVEIGRRQRVIQDGGQIKQPRRWHAAVRAAHLGHKGVEGALDRRLLRGRNRRRRLFRHGSRITEQFINSKLLPDLNTYSIASLLPFNIRNVGFFDTHVLI